MNAPSYFFKDSFYSFSIKLYNLAQLVGFLSFRRMYQQTSFQLEENASNYVTSSVTEIHCTISQVIEERFWQAQSLSGTGT